MWDASNRRRVMHMIFLSTSTPIHHVVFGLRSNTRFNRTGMTILPKRSRGYVIRALAFPFPSDAERLVWYIAGLLNVALSLVVLTGAWTYQGAYDAYRSAGAGRRGRGDTSLDAVAEGALQRAVSAIPHRAHHALRTDEWTSFIAHFITSGIIANV